MLLGMRKQRLESSEPFEKRSKTPSKGPKPTLTWTRFKGFESLKALYVI